MRSRLLLVTAVAVAAATVLAPASARPAADPGSRVIVSTTLNSSLVFLDSRTLEQTQPPLPSRGGGPVRLAVHRVGGRDLLLAANHGVARGSLGIFDLSGPVVTEMPLSPAPAGVGSVGVAAADVAGRPLAFVTSTWFALGGCGMPEGSVEAFDLTHAATLGLARPLGSAAVGGSIPYAVAATSAGEAYATVACGDALMRYQVDGDTLVPAGRATTGRTPDGLVVDEQRGRVYTVDIGGGTVSVFATGAPLGGGAATTVSLGAGSGPIEIASADTSFGHDLLVTANGGDHSVSVLDRDAIEACIAQARATCAGAEVLRVATRPGGAPEGIAFDPATDRVFVVNKPAGSPSLTVVQLSEENGSLRGTVVGDVRLGALGTVEAGRAPALIAFDVVVQPR